MIRPRERILRAVAGLAYCATLLAVAACGGGTSQSVGVPASSTQTATLHVALTVPTATTSSRRKPDYVSVSTRSMKVTVTSSNGVARSPVLVVCTSFCQAQLAAPVGNDHVNISLTDMPDGTGNELSLADTVVAVAPNTDNQLNITTNPVVRSATIALGALQTSSVATNAGTAMDEPITVRAYDAQNNLIVGPGSFVDGSGNPMTLSVTVANASAGGSGGVTIVGGSSITSPAGAAGLVARYNGGWLDHATIGLSSSDASVAVSAPAVLTATPHAVEFGSGLSANSHPNGITAGPDGNVWFTEFGSFNGNSVGKMTPSGVVTEYSTGITPSSVPIYIAAGPDGNLWFTEYAANHIARITPGGVVTEFSGMLGHSPERIVSGPQGKMWFTEYGGDRLGSITMSGVITDFPLTGSYPTGVMSAPDGNLWVSYSASALLSRVTPSGVVTDSPYSDASTNGLNDSLAVGSDGNYWFIDRSGQFILRYAPGTGIFTPFTSGITSTAYLRNIIAGPDGALYYISLHGELGRIATDGSVIEYGSASGISTCCLTDLTVGPDGNIYYTEGQYNHIGKFVF